MTGPNPLAVSRVRRARASRPVRSRPGARTAVLAAAAIAVGCTAAAMVSFATDASPGTSHAVLAGVTVGVALMFLAVLLAAGAAARQTAGHARAARALAERGQAEADAPPRARPGQQVVILVNLAGRMQSLVHREIEMLDVLESQVEDPEQLKGLYAVDHLATRMRRQCESLAVLGGTASLRQWSRPVSMQEVLRAAVAEIEQYPRVKVVPPVEGLLRGTAVADVIHLIAELAENATKFSSPRTQVLLRAQAVRAGVAIEVEDRGLGMTPPDLQRMNDLLADPGRIAVDEPLRDGRIGLYVVAVLAGRHGIHVELRPSIYGGTSAAVIIPQALLEGHDLRLPAWQREPTPADPEPALAEGPASLPSPHAPAACPPWGIPAPAPGLPRRPAAADAGRTPLPTRQPQASLAARLHGSAGGWQRDSGTAGPHGPAPGQRPDLMADFLSGVRQSEGAAGRAATG